jgi:predicted nucleic acid-binding protein
MTKGSLRCVIDASVAIKLFVVDPLSDKVDALFAHLGADPECRFYVPDLFYIECTNILWKYVRLSPYSAADAERNLAQLYALSLQRTSTAELMTDALKIGLAHGISAYDACYVALSQRLTVPMVTADQKLVRKLATSSPLVYYLEDFPIPELP